MTTHSTNETLHAFSLGKSLRLAHVTALRSDGTFSGAVRGEKGGRSPTPSRRPPPPSGLLKGSLRLTQLSLKQLGSCSLRRLNVITAEIIA